MHRRQLRDGSATLRGPSHGGPFIAVALGLERVVTAIAVNLSSDSCMHKLSILIEKGERVVSLRARAIGYRARALLGNYGQEQRGSTIERLRTIILIRAVRFRWYQDM
jgi:hypothetical protein